MLHCDSLRLCFFSLTDFWGFCDCTYRVLLQIEQVRDWQMYIAANWNVIVAELEKHSFSNTKLPRQLYKYCPYQIYYAVIAGLRKDFENIRDRKLQLQNENNITLLHYENLIDVANEN